MDLTQTAKDYNASLSPEGRLWLQKRGLSDESIGRALLGECYAPPLPHQRFEGAISLPYFNPDGSIRSIRFRNFRPGAAHKYDSVAGVQQSLYNVVATSERAVWIAEGEFDSLILTQMGFPAVAMAGVSAFKPAWKYLFRYCEEVSIVLDGDAPGQKAAGRLASILGDQVDNLRLIYLPDGKDCTDLFLSDAEALRVLVA